MKRNSVGLKTLCERASKTKKTDSTSPTEPSSVEVEFGPQNQINPSSELQVVQVEPQNGRGTQPGIDTSKEPEIGSPIRGDDELNDEDEAGYDLDLISHDPGKRIPISSYDVNEQDSVRRKYIALGPCQPRKHNFPARHIGGMRRFVAAWFDEFDWLEYSVEKDAAFCFICFLFKDQTTPGRDNFVNGGFRNWNMRRRLEKHVGDITSSHNNAQEKYNWFMQPKSSIQEVLAANTKEYKALYLSRLTYSLKCLRFLLQQGLAFHGHDESEASLNRGNFLELLKWLAQNFREVDNVVLNNDRFDEVNTELLVCMASFNPAGSFSAYDKEKLVKLAYFYPKDFSKMELVHLPFQLTNFIGDMRRDVRFREVKNIADLSIKLVETKKNVTYNLVYKLLKLVLVLPVATATVDRVFSSMSYVKNMLRNKMGGQYLNDCLVTYLEKEFFFQVKDDTIISRFQALENRKVVL